MQTTKKHVRFVQGGRRRRSSSSSTRRRRQPKPSACSPESLVAYLMEMLNAIKIYHWNTHSFAQHKATDELHERLSGNVDRFVEVLLGQRAPKRIALAKQFRIPLNNFHGAAELRAHITQFRQFLIIDVARCFKTAPDLLNIRDEIVADLNQFLYLLTLR